MQHRRATVLSVTRAHLGLGGPHPSIDGRGPDTKAESAGDAVTDQTRQPIANPTGKDAATQRPA